MIEDMKNVFPETYINPVYPKSFPDPFVLKFRGEYYAYCTDFWRDGRVFGVLNSRDLVNWTEIGGAMRKLETDATHYWAPEVTYSNGKFYLYYSVGNETFMEIRVAVSDRPDGGFVDSGQKLTNEDFAIDAHLFFDTNGEKYLFYATDFLTHSHIGTGTVVDKMLDFFNLEGDPRPVTRARYDWQIYDPNRKEKGGVRWHTVEGAFVLKRKGIYYEMFSGGNWQNPTYGVSFAVTDDIEKDEEWQQFSDGEKVFPILRTLENSVIGPGHNSVIRGVNNRELFCVYHRWAEGGRVLAIDRMDFAGGARMFIKGASVSSQPAPFAPQVLDFFDEFSGENWEIISGDWKTENNQIISEKSANAELVCRKTAEIFLLETSLRLVEGMDGKFGINLKDKEEIIFSFLFAPDKKCAVAVWFENEEKKTQVLELRESFDFEAFHLLRIESDHFSLKISIDESTEFYRRNLQKIPKQISLKAEKCRAAFSGAALTAGFENLFEKDDFEQTGWEKQSDAGDYRIKNRELTITERKGDKAIFQKNFAKNDYELTVNFRLVKIFDEDFKFSFYPVFKETEETLFFALEKKNRNWIIKIEKAKNGKQFDLPENFSPDIFHQISFLKRSDKITIWLETEIIGEVEIPETSTKIAVGIQNASAAFDMIRVTAL